jgi:hypothetical protein
MSPASQSTSGLLPFQQGGLDSLYRLYSVVNAGRTINHSSDKETQQHETYFLS